MKRVVWVDNFKAISIFLVVVGHFSLLDVSIKQVIYAFHIPAFVFITGYLSLNSIAKSSFVSFLFRHIIPYVLIYLLFSIFAFFVWYFLEARTEDFLSALGRVAYGVFYGVQGADRLLIHHNAPLWYFPFLITSLAISYFLLKLPVWAQCTLVLFYGLFSVTYTGPRLPWCIDIAGIGVFFIFLGAWFKQYADHIDKIVSSRMTMYMVCSIVFGLFVVLAMNNGVVNVNRASFGEIPFFLYPIAVLGILFLFFLCKLLSGFSFLRVLSEHTLVIFCLHIFFLKALNKLSFTYGPLVDAGLVVFMSTIVVAVCVMVSIFIKPWIEKYLFFRT
ncbi:MAG: acyltransferase family protein [Cellvibrionaceae bacterium]